VGKILVEIEGLDSLISGSPAFCYSPNETKQAIVIQKFVDTVNDWLIKEKISRYKSFLNSSIFRPASIIIPAMVYALIGFALGIVMILLPLAIVICLPCLSIQNHIFGKLLRHVDDLSPVDSA
jgi:hypothetical protein